MPHFGKPEQVVTPSRLKHKSAELHRTPTPAELEQIHQDRLARQKQLQTEGAGRKPDPGTLTRKYPTAQCVDCLEEYGPNFTAPPLPIVALDRCRKHYQRLYRARQKEKRSTPRPSDSRP